MSEPNTHPYTTHLTENRFNVLSDIELEKSHTEIAQTFQQRIRNKIKKSSTNIALDKNKHDKNGSHLIILADSHGRDIGHLTYQRTSVNVSSYVRPGAPFNKVIEDVQELSEHLGKEDHVLVIAGTNSIETTEINHIIEDVLRLIENTQHTNLILGTVPMRHDVSHLDLRTSMVNAEIERIAREHSNIKLLPLHFLPRHFYTSHGLHLNRRGKSKVASDISNLLSRKKKKTNENLINTCFGSALSDINVVEADMNNILEIMQNDTSVAFSHTISADLSHPRNMSAGVAVLFKKKFGRPTSSDFVRDKLTCQRMPSGVVIYSLITKAKYFDKPTEQDYDLAFSQLTQEFKQRDLKTLICSPMGCVRDNVKLEHFAKNIVEFQLATGCTVYIVSCKQKSATESRSHPNMLEQLKREIAEVKGTRTGLLPKDDSMIKMASEEQQSTTQHIQTSLHPQVATQQTFLTSRTEQGNILNSMSLINSTQNEPTQALNISQSTHSTPTHIHDTTGSFLGHMLLETPPL